MEFEFQISPRILCSCGKSTRGMTKEEREVYDKALRKIGENSQQFEKDGASEKTEQNACPSLSVRVQ